MTPEPEKLAWIVEIRGMTCIVFATTKAKAQWQATKGYWEAFDRRKGEWPRACAGRAPQHDRSLLRFKEQCGWAPDYVRDYPEGDHV